MRPKSPWDNASTRLKKLYDERVPPGMSQREFGRIYGIGSQSMVAQYLNGARPLHFEVAAKFARGLRCHIDDICPEMANSLAIDILPYLRKKLLRRAALLVMALQLGGQPFDANAEHNHVLHKNGSQYTFQAILRILRRMFGLRFGIA